MKKRILITVWTVITAITAQAQVTQINSNKSLHVTFPLNNNITIVVSDIDSSIWATDATLPGTVQISPDIKYEGFGGLLSGKLIFRGSTAANGSEIYITDGTIPGTGLVKDIYTGPTSSAPGDFTSLSGFIYFSAVTAAEGRELWKTNGTLAGTTLLKDIVPGTDSSNKINQYHLFSNGTYLLFAARTPSTGIELWKSDGTTPGTVLLKDINIGNAGADSSNPRSFFAYNSMVLFVATDATHGEEVWETDGTPGGTVLLKDINTGNAGADSSKPRAFYLLNNIVLFLATDATHGEEVWKTDGTEGGTALLKDINVGTANSTTADLFGFSFPVFFSFHTFNNRAYFNANDGTSTGEVWGTDGTPANTTLLKDIVTSTTSISFVLLIDAVNLPTKFIFPVSDGTSRSELWESDGTPAGTKLFKAFSPITAGDFPFIFLSYSYDSASGTLTYPLFQGNKFFFKAGTTTEGDELWISDGVDGTFAHTHTVKDINPGTGNGINSFSYLYTTTALYFSANDGTHGNELWKTDGTNAGTAMVFDIYPGAGDADPELSIICNGKIIFSATNGDDPVATDLYVVDGTFTPLPVKLADFTVMAQAADALLQWHTLQELNSKDFTIQRSFDGVHFDNIGSVAALGTSSTRHGYTFTDAGIINSQQSVVYYRLLSADIDGKGEYSQVITLKLKGSQWNVRLLANPVLGDVRVAFTGITGNVQVAINDVNGKTVYTNKLLRVNAPISIPATNLPHGFYVLVITNGNEKKSIRFIK